MNRKVLIVGLVVITPLLVFLALSFRSDPRVIESPLIGKPAPSFTLMDLDGQVVGLEDLKGKPVVLNFWATWCQPCIVEHPVLLAGARRYAGQVEFLGVIYQDKPELIRRFMQERGAWGPALIDPEVEVAIAYGVYGAPETFFIDAQGIIVAKIRSAVDPYSLVRIIDGMLKGQAS
jgi:cytochrome c biogenesis protein CcmG/thiol:disulfide interchange protein DsbE